MQKSILSSISKALILLVGIFSVVDTSGQSITIEPNPSNGVMLNIKNKPATPINMDFGTSHVMTVPKVVTLPASPQEGMLAFNNSKLQYFNGSAWIALESPNILPVSTMVLSETNNNTNLSSNGFSLRGLTNMTYNPISYGSFGWVKQLNSSNAPTARESHSAVWTGSSMIVWGGFDNNNLNSGKMYNPTTDTWTNISNSFLSGRFNHAAVWTGNKMLVWGGSMVSGNNIVDFTDGALYDPNTDIWSTISNTNAPQARQYFSTVWTGDKMIIWGGDIYSAEGTGKMYTPTSNTWTSISSTNAPSSRQFHSAVWTGSKMIVWGGSTTTETSTATGKIFDPANNTWTNMSTANAPSLSGHKAVWTGSKMIVFGGQIGSTPSNACYLYDPSADSWSVASTINKPSERTGHTAIWTGSKMIVFGGRQGYASLNDGGYYNPENDTWGTDNLELNNFSYVLHTAIWAGEDMIVFGQSPGHLLKKDFKAPITKTMYFYQKY